ncbi:MAG: hypothetical protein AABZ12_14290 [Planctomycetota bacterium]
MTIRFQCPACGQPLEVDDPLAMQVVGCPYCHKTVTAPAASTVFESPVLPVARPFVEHSGAAPPPHPLPPPSRNGPAVAALVLACVLVFLQFASAAIASRHAVELQDFMREFERSSGDVKAQWTAFNAFVAERGGAIPVWLVAFCTMQLAVLAAWLAAGVCGLIGLRVRHRRRSAIVALAVCGGYLLLFLFPLLTS